MGRGAWCAQSALNDLETNTYTYMCTHVQSDRCYILVKLGQRYMGILCTVLANSLVALKIIARLEKRKRNLELRITSQ